MTETAQAQSAQFTLTSLRSDERELFFCCFDAKLKKFFFVEKEKSQKTKLSHKSVVNGRNLSCELIQYSS